MFALFLIIICIASVFLSKVIYKTSYNPVNFFVTANVVTLLMGLIYTPPLMEFENWLELDVLIMLISFISGASVSHKIQLKKFAPSARFYKRLYSLIMFTSIIYDIALFFYLHNLFSNFSIYQFFQEMSEVNHFVQSDEYFTGINYFFLPLGLPLSLLVIYYSRTKGWTYLSVIQYFLCFLHCLSPRRGYLFTFIVVTTLFLIVTREKAVLTRKHKYIIVVGAVIAVAIMSWTQILMNKSSDSTLTFLGITLPSFLTSPYYYLSLNYPYLNTLDYNSITETTTPFLATGRLFYRYIMSGFDTMTPFALDFRNVGGGIITNTAPILYYSYLDFGGFFFVFFIILGIIGNIAFSAIKTGKITFVIFSVYYYQLLIMSIRGYDIIYLTFDLSLIYIFIMHQYLFRR